MSYTQTPNYNLYKPTINADNDAWGGHLNTNADTIDTQLKAVANTAATVTNYLPLTGGTVAGNLIVNGIVTNTSNTLQLRNASGTITAFSLQSSGGTVNGQVYYDTSVNAAYFQNTLSNANAWLDAAGNFSVSGAAYKPGGGSWSTPSDARIKNVLGDYATGLEAIRQLRPVVYSYLANDALAAGAASPHAGVMGRQFVGLVAQDVEPIMPTMVRKRPGWIDGIAVDDLRDLDTAELVFALVNAVKALAADVAALKNAQQGAR